MTRETLQFTLTETKSSRMIDFSVRELVLAGYSGRNQEDVREHFKELEELGLTPPEETPILFRVSPYLATTGDRVAVQNSETSGEVEFVLLLDGNKTYVTCGSDHTSRSFERYSIPASKQMYPKFLASRVWPYEDVRDHWDRLILRSWAHSNGERVAYQDSPLSAILEPEALIEAASRRMGMGRNGTVLMSGTIPTLTGGMVYANRFEIEFEDPVLQRRIRHAYDIGIL